MTEETQIAADEGSTPEAVVADPQEQTANTDEGISPHENLDADLDAELDKVWAKGQSDSDEEPEEQSENSDSEVKSSEDQAQDSGKEGTVEAIPVPESWSAEAKEAWDSMPPEIQKYVSERDNDTHTKISQQGHEIKQLEPMKDVFEQYKDDFSKYGFENPIEGFRGLAETQRYLERNPYSAIEKLAQAYGVDLAKYSAQGTENTGENPAVSKEVAAEVAALRGELMQTKQELTVARNQEIQEQEAAISKTVNDFASTKEHWTTVEPYVMAAVNALNADPDTVGLSVDEKLEKAYETACWSSPDVRQILTKAEADAKEKELIEATKKAGAKAKRASPLTAKSTPAGKKPGTMDDTLSEIANKHYG